jgi:hypothetical protein
MVVASSVPAIAIAFFNPRRLEYRVKAKGEIRTNCRQATFFRVSSEPQHSMWIVA